MSNYLEDTLGGFALDFEVLRWRIQAVQESFASDPKTIVAHREMQDTLRVAESQFKTWSAAITEDVLWK